MNGFNDVEWIFVVLLILLTLESLLWLPKGSYPFAGSFGRRKTGGPRTSWFGNDNGNVFPAGATPLDGCFIAEALPISIGTAGIYGFLIASGDESERLPHSGLFIPWSEVKSRLARDEKQLLDGDRLFVKLRSKHVADELHQALTKLAELDGPARASGIGLLRRREFDGLEVAAVVEAWSAQTKRLRFWSLAFLIWVLPIGFAYYAFGLSLLGEPDTLIAFLVVAFALWLFVIVATWRVMKSFRELPLGKRWKFCITVILSPGVAFKIADQISRELLTLRHPAAVAESLASESARLAFLQRLWADLAHPIFPPVPESAAEEAAETAVEHHERTRELLLEVAKRCGLGQTELEPKHPKSDLESAGYCPRCQREYTHLEVGCTPCGGRPVVAF